MIHTIKNTPRRCPHTCVTVIITSRLNQSRSFLYFGVAVGVNSGKVYHLQISIFEKQL